MGNEDRAYCPDCGHEKKHHMNFVACCAVVGKDSSSEHFEGANKYCYCERTEGFVPASGLPKRVAEDILF